MKRALILGALTMISAVYASKPRVISSIYPLQQIANAIVGETTTLVADSYLSPHHFSLKPSKAKQLMSADIALWVGGVMMPQLDKYMQRRSKTTITVAKLPHIQLLSADEQHSNRYRYAQAESHNHEHNSLSYDPHLWLSLKNANIIAEALAKELIAKDPENKKHYEENLLQFQHSLEDSKRFILTTFENNPVQEYYVFHNAYRYFEEEFGITKAGVVRMHAGQSPKTRHLNNLRKKIKNSSRACLFREPQFNSPIVSRLVEESSIIVSVLDPIGYEKGKNDGYNKIIRDIAIQITNCGKVQIK